MALSAKLGLFDAFSIGLGAIIGAGIFVVTGVAAGVAGPGLMLSLIIAAVVSAFTAMSFAELARRVPKDGGGYEFAHEMISPLGGFISGWLWLSSNVITGAVVALGFASYLAIFIPLPVNLIAAAACIVVTIVNYLGMKDSALLNDILVVFKVIVLAAFFVIGALFVKPSNFAPFLPKGTIGVMEGAALVFFAYAGFGRVAMVSEEVRDPQRTVPKAILLSLVISALIYFAVSFVAIGIIGTPALAGSGSPLADAAASANSALANGIALAALAATLSVLLTTVLGMSRISYAMARNHDFPRALMAVHKKRGTPYVSILLLGSLMTIMALFSNLLLAAVLSNFASIIYYLLVNVSAFRMKEPLYSRAFPVLGMVTCLALLPFLGIQAWEYGAIILVVGIIAFYVLRWVLARRSVKPFKPIR